MTANLEKQPISDESNAQPKSKSQPIPENPCTQPIPTSLLVSDESNAQPKSTSQPIPENSCTQPIPANLPVSNTSWHQPYPQNQSVTGGYYNQPAPNNQQNSSIIINNVSPNNLVPKYKWRAFFLCLFLGGLGVHKFYEGKSGQGVMYLLSTLILGPFTLGIMNILVLICVFVDLIIMFCCFFINLVQNSTRSFFHCS